MSSSCSPPRHQDIIPQQKMAMVGYQNEISLFCINCPLNNSGFRLLINSILPPGWLKQCTGALSLVKDSNKRSYYCRIYCLMRNELVWEQELYSTIEFKQPRPYLITFEGEIGHFALNFAAKEEAEHFFRFATKMMESRQRRRQRNAPPRPTANPPSAPSTGGGNSGGGGGGGDSEVVLRNQSSK